MNIDRLTKALAYPDLETEGEAWDAIFNWHRDEDDEVKRRAAAEIIARRYGADPILSKAGIETSAQLEKTMAELELVDILRVFSAAGHAILHRSPRIVTAEDLTRELVAGINELHAMGLD